MDEQYLQGYDQLKLARSEQFISLKKEGFTCLTTKVPCPLFTSNTPKATIILIASRIEFLPTPNCSINSTSVGSLFPVLAHR